VVDDLSRHQDSEEEKSEFNEEEKSEFNEEEKSGFNEEQHRSHDINSTGMTPTHTGWLNNKYFCI